jgi:enediyne biosynthesis protein E4
MRAILSLGLLLPLCAFAQTAVPKSLPSPQSPVPQFKDVAQEAGLTISHISTPEKKYIVESMSGGAGLIDCDNDGRLDIITVNGSTIAIARAAIL